MPVTSSKHHALLVAVGLLATCVEHHVTAERLGTPILGSVGAPSQIVVSCDGSAVDSKKVFEKAVHGSDNASMLTCVTGSAETNDTAQGKAFRIVSSELSDTRSAALEERGTVEDVVRAPPRPVLSSVTVPRLAPIRSGAGLLARCSGSPDIKSFSKRSGVWLALCLALASALTENPSDAGLVAVKLTRAFALGSQAALRATQQPLDPSASGGSDPSKGSRLKVMKVNFEVVLSPNATEDFVESIYAGLQVLSEGGLASERFDVALDRELANHGLAALPDGAHSLFGRPRRLPPLETQADADILMPFLVLFFGFGIVLCTMVTGIWMATDFP